MKKRFEVREVGHEPAYTRWLATFKTREDADRYALVANMWHANGPAWPMKKHEVVEVWDD